MAYGGWHESETVEPDTLYTATAVSGHDRGGWDCVPDQAVDREYQWEVVFDGGDAEKRGRKRIAMFDLRCFICECVLAHTYEDHSHLHMLCPSCRNFKVVFLDVLRACPVSALFKDFQAHQDAFETYDKNHELILEINHHDNRQRYLLSNEWIMEKDK